METSENLINTVYTPLLISGTGIIITAIAILVYHFVILRFCINTERHRSRFVFDDDSVQLKITNQGFDKRILDKIPTVRYSSSAQNDGCDGGGECAICLGEFEENVVVRLLPRCKHAFHVECVDQWLSFHTNCPFCRSPVCPIVISEVPAVCVEDRDDHHPHDRGRVDEERRRFDSVDKEKPQGVVLGLKRSFSMDQYHVLIDMLQRKSDDKNCDPSSSSSASSSSKECLRQSGSYTARFDRKSSVLMMSFSQMRMARTNSTSNIANGSDSTDLC
ncbi:hypothetical protein TIFTF001_008520 [Ficus carica]|uniref:RING-type E3 ubiquitin transferase n=1 Tax=Ficus carica TaxID=3494 RepID=A0AA88AF74_FICCA|nr:hypothetical protein TIFTF001_008520 [Ficus carica]